MIRFVDILECKVGSLPTTYLGLPLCSRMANKFLWNPVVERMEKKVTTWKANYLSLGGRMNLIRSALSSLPIYYMSICKCPASIANRIEKLQ